MTIVEAAPGVTGGVDTHLDNHVAAALDPLGRLVGTESFRADAAGYKALLGWLETFGEVTKVGIEGTGSYGAGLSRFLRRRGVAIVEVNRPNRQARRNHGKSDPLDAVEAARAALSGRATGSGKTKDGPVQAIRVLVVAKRSARVARIAAITQMRHLGFTAPEQLPPKRPLRAGIGGRSSQAATNQIDRFDNCRDQGFTLVVGPPGPGSRRRDRRAGREDRVPLARYCAGSAGPLRCGTDTAAALLVAAGDNPERLHSEAAWAHLCGVSPIPADSGKSSGHYRRHNGGDRQANSALWRIVMVRIAHDPETRLYFERRVKEGRSKRDIIRILKRYVAREVYRYLPRG